MTWQNLSQVHSSLGFTPHEMGDNLKLVKPVYNTMQYGFRSIIYQGALIWNSLPVELKQVDELPCSKIY